MNTQYLRSVYPNELYHHGILGQKWGIRRFQNKDGSYTSAGKARYSDTDDKERPETRDNHGTTNLSKNAMNMAKDDLIQINSVTGMISPLMALKLRKMTFSSKRKQQIIDMYIKRNFKTTIGGLVK